MGREIEIKIPLFQNEYDKLFQVLINQTEKIPGIQIVKYQKNLIVKSDEYYSKYDSREERKVHNEPQVIRIRTEEINGVRESYFTLKFKTCENGIEFNKEDETFIQDACVVQEFFEIAGYKRFFYKVKKNYSAFCKSEYLGNLEFHVELENVNNLLYVEIEVVQDEGEPEKIKAALNDFVVQLGLNPEKKDSRSWMDILLTKN